MFFFSGLTNDIDIDDNFIQHYDDFEAKDYLIVDDPIAPKYRKKSKISSNSNFDTEENSSKGKWKQESRNVRKSKVKEIDYEICRTAVYKILGNPVDLINFPCDDDLGTFIIFEKKNLNCI